MSAKFDEFTSLPFQDIKEKPKPHRWTHRQMWKQYTASAPPPTNLVCGGSAPPMLPYRTPPYRTLLPILPYTILPSRTPSYRTLLPILPYTILPSSLHPKSIPSYPLHTFNTPRFPSIYILLHSTLSYSSVPYPKLLHPTPTETRLNWPRPKRLMAETTCLIRPNRPTIRW